ncbi:protease inhibitor I42 family protein [Streptomyces albireticuli]|uniref:protease inhibitor I42 family protein n=1 Tax=Streptomyces albireticuli TaxID=1940 RepID=UPI00117F9624|nr:protease inhibitor I42 family protein [Streptomyces albireticuli]MCD9195120.1 hypothetical protein [Streptomyces albireticuli]
MKAVRCLITPLAVALALTAGTASAEAPAKRVVLTNPDSGRAVEVSLGDDIEVRLERYYEKSRTYTWDAPQTSDAAVLTRTKGAVTADGSAAAVFRAKNQGVATISVTRKCRPDDGHICPLIIVPWKAKIKVK